MSIVNFYAQPKVKKFLSNGADPQRAITGMSINSRILFCGASGSGKTNALLNYISLTSQGEGTFSQMYLCYKTDEPLYDYLRENMKGGEGLQCFKSITEFPSASEFPDGTDSKKLIVFDDCVLDKDKASQKKIGEFFAFGRKKGLTIAFLSQSYFDTPTFIRKQMNYLILTSIRGKRDLTLICRDYLGSTVSIEQLLQMYDEATSAELNFFKIDVTACPLNRKFSRNFLDFMAT